jgi:hypothetical protein
MCSCSGRLEGAKRGGTPIKRYEMNGASGSDHSQINDNQDRDVAL